MKILKSEQINPILRSIRKIWMRMGVPFGNKFFSRIRVSGEVDLKVKDIRFKMYSNFDDGIVDSLYFSKLNYSEQIEIELFSMLAAKSKVVFDIGANTGLYSIVSRKANKNSEIYSFEPYIVNANRLHKNLEINQINDITLIEQALGDKSGMVEFAIPAEEQICDVLSADVEFTNKFYRKWTSYKTTNVNQNTLDNIVKENEFKRIDLVKIDVENYELQVLNGALDSLQNFSPLILIEIFVEQQRVDYYKSVLKPMGYFCYGILPTKLLRINELTHNLKCRNFILTKKKSTGTTIPFSNKEEILGLLSD